MTKSRAQALIRCAVAIALALAACAVAIVIMKDRPTLAECCLDPAAPATCDDRLYERKGSTLEPDGRCPPTAAR